MQELCTYGATINYILIPSDTEHEIVPNDDVQGGGHGMGRDHKFTVARILAWRRRHSTQVGAWPADWIRLRTYDQTS